VKNPVGEKKPAKSRKKWESENSYTKENVDILKEIKGNNLCQEASIGSLPTLLGIGKADLPAKCLGIIKLKERSKNRLSGGKKKKFGVQLFLEGLDKETAMQGLKLPGRSCD